jgi:hypothetical protein
MKKFMLAVIFALSASVLLGFTGNANAGECSLYEQSHPSFTLDGAHLSTGKCSVCASCHRAGVFVGTPKSCVECHNGDPARVTVGRSMAHIPTGLVECSFCHTTSSFVAGFHMDHTSVAAQRCDSCHGGAYKTYNARPKPNDHVPTTADCLTCHTTHNWDVSHSAIHAGVTTNCISCHNNSITSGKASSHPVTSDACELCHSINANFKCAVNLPSGSKKFAATNLVLNNS